MVIELPGGGLVRRPCGHALDGSSDGDACRACDLRRLPAGLIPARTTPAFTAATVPPALLSDHRTSAWAELVVVEGHVDFEEPATGHARMVIAGRTLVIVPDRVHRITPSDDAVFHVRFLRFAQPDDTDATSTMEGAS